MTISNNICRYRIICCLAAIDIEEQIKKVLVLHVKTARCLVES